MISRRNFLMTTLFGAGAIGMRALATGLPASFLINPRRALANPLPACPANAQYVILNTSGQGDPLNASVPGTYLTGQNIAHAQAPSMAPTSLMMSGQQHTAAAPWATLPQSVLDRTCFWHTMTNTPVHPKEPDVLRLMGATYASEMFPSVISKALAPCLGTLQSQPITLGATSPTEALSYNGQALPVIPPLALKATLTNPTGALTDLQPLRDQTLNALYDLYRTDATPAQKAYIDSLVTSQAEVRGISQNLLSSLDMITDNSPDGQIIGALALIQMKVSPVVAIHIPFGGDNHHDPDLATETAQTISGVASIASLMSQLSSLSLADKVTFVSLNVFGRTLGPANTAGRSHNPNHHVGITIGRGFVGGVIGGIAPVGNDFGAMAIDATTGLAATGGNISARDTLAAFGKTTLAAVGVDPGLVTGGAVVTSALTP